MSGNDEVDLEDWISHTTYDGVYSSSHRTITHFWSVMADLTNEELRQMVRFVTGTSSVPVGGFCNLQGSDGNVRKFTIRSIGDGDVGEMGSVGEEYPVAHTCFNRLDLPQYKSRDHV